MSLSRIETQQKIEAARSKARELYQYPWLAVELYAAVQLCEGGAYVEAQVWVPERPPAAGAPLPHTVPVPPGRTYSHLPEENSPEQELQRKLDILKDASQKFLFAMDALDCYLTDNRAVIPSHDAGAAMRYTLASTRASSARNTLIAALGI